MKVVLVGPFWFPRGSAASARMRNLALGLRDCGAAVHVLSMAPRPRVPDETADPGLAHFEGITHESVAPTSAAALGWRDPERTVPRLRRRLVDQVRWFTGLYASTPFACRRLAELIRRGRCDLAFVYDRSALRLLPLARVCRAHGVPSVLDVTEVSEHLSRRRSLLYWDFAVGTRVSPRLFDGHTLITTGLAALYRARGCERRLVVPALEAWPEQPPPPPTGRADFRLAYVGSLHPRDAPELLFEAMRLLGEASPAAAVGLDVIGQYDGTERGARFRALCAADRLLKGRVRFLGTLGDDRLRDHLAGADGLVLTRRDARPEALSFPTRLVEHLRGGRPVFVSDVGDVSLYLRDGRDAVLLHPGDPKLVASAIAAIASRPDRGAVIGRSGREAGARAFDRRLHAARLLDFAAGLRRLEVAA
jgi:glycosyltransferase involved in cell wall biosynthesis